MEDVLIAVMAWLVTIIIAMLLGLGALYLIIKIDEQDR
jgi:hypothetical protein